MTTRPAQLDVADFQHGYARRAVAGVGTLCGIYIGSEQESPRYTHARESVTCPMCLLGMKWPTRRDVEPSELATRFRFLADGSVVDSYGEGGR